MLKDRIIELLDTDASCSEDYKKIVASVIEYEQKYISYELRTNDLRLKEIKQKIRDEIEIIYSKKKS